MNEESRVDWLGVAMEQAEEADNEINDLKMEIYRLNKQIDNFKDQIKALIKEKYRRIESDSNN